MRPIVCFGEILWDALPRGLFLGGAPLNVARHLARLDRRARLISAVGADFLGDEAMRHLAGAGVDTALVARTADAPTGAVRVELDAAGQARYVFLRPAAWDFIGENRSRSPRDWVAARAAARGAGALVFGSLALRAPGNRRVLAELLRARGPRKIFDINLRPPFDGLRALAPFLRQADLVKLNDGELARLAGVAFAPTDDPRPLLEKLRARTGVARWCVTLGARGAVWWDGGPLVRAAAPVVRVRDTVGAGDAFLAALVDGLTRDGRVDWPAPKAMALWLARACRLGALVAGRDGACPDYDPAEIMDADAVPKRPRTAVRSP